MEYRNLGKSGLQVSAVGLGCNNFGMRIDADQTKVVVDKAVELGINFFDTADVYGARGKSEEFLGAAIKPHRRNIILATKFRTPMGEGPLWGGGSRKYIFEAVDASMQRLNTDYIDLYQMHFPDVTTPIEETMHALDDVVKSGRVRYVGCSNYTGWQVVEAQWVARTGHLSPFISAQNQYNLLDRRIERDLGQVAEKYGVGVLPYFPLANGFLTGKYRPGQPPPEGTRIAAMGQRAQGVLTDQNFAVLTALEEFALQRGHTMLDLAIGWLASHPWVSSVIAGATKPEQLEQNVAAGAWKLTSEEMAEVEKLTRRPE
ncbi:MAG: aldo/keto reductase [Chloroflexi bacterium]|nr:aldo/keto reductase [Chloroflexota bacterium]